MTPLFTEVMDIDFELSPFYIQFYRTDISLYKNSAILWLDTNNF
mgnify:CR=1 FL=1